MFSKQSLKISNVLNVSSYSLRNTSQKIGCCHVNLLRCKPEASPVSAVKRLNLFTSKPFHTSAKQNALPALGPLLIKLASPLSRLGAILVGRQVRKWWRKLPEKNKERYLSNLKKRTDKILIAVFGTLGVSFLYYSYHIEETPMTNRKRFMIMSDKQIKDIAEREFLALTNELRDSFLPTNHPSHMRVFRIAKRILHANMTEFTEGKNWEVNVVESDIANAFVLPNGQIFIMSGMINLTANDDELAGILGHEIAHAILRHSAEQLSFSGFFGIFNIIILTSLYAVIPSDALAIFAHWIESKIQDVLIHLPYGRVLEKEADCVGLHLAANACFDVRKISNFWKRMDQMEQESDQLEWLSTHPSHANRARWINDWLPQALESRRASKCPELLSFSETVSRSIGSHLLSIFYR